MWVAGLAGLTISAYLTAVHLTAVPLVCSTAGAINCELVLASPYAVIGGTAIPTSAAGILWFSVSDVLAGLRLVGADTRFVARLQLAWSTIGLLPVVGLVFIEIALLGAICIWCSAAHALVLVIFLLTLQTRMRT